MALQHFFMLSPDPVFAALVNQASFEYDLTSVEFDNVSTGAYTAVKAGMTVLFGSTAGADDKGRQRIRLAADTDTIFIGRSSQGIRDGEVDLEDNDHITILDDFRAWAKIPDIESGVVVKDEIAYTDQTSEIPPKANIAGGWRASTINSGTSLSTFQFVGTASYAVASGATISTYLWDVDDGTITVGTSASNTITATFPAGKRWVSLTVTDSNGKTHIMRVLVYAHDPADSECVAFECLDQTISQQGQQASFRVLEDIPISTHPDGTAVIFWEGEPASASDYSNVKFWGWHQTNTNTITAERRGTLKDTVLICLDIAGRLDTLPGFPEGVYRAASPDSWYQILGLNMNLYIDYLLRWHSTAFENAYYVSSIPGSTYPMVNISSDGESLFDQAARMAGALLPDYALTCNRNGELNIIVDPFLQDTGDRTATSQATITDAHFTGASWDDTRPPRFHWSWGEAVKTRSSGNSSAFFCRAPGVAPGQGLSSNTTSFKLVPDQDTLNSTEGHRYGYINAFTGQLILSLAADSGIDPADMTWVTVTIADTYTRRSLGFSAVRFMPVEVNIIYSYDRRGMFKTVELVLEKETSGTPATTYIPPGTDWDWVPPPVNIPPPPPTTTPGTGFGTVYVMTIGVLARTRAFSAASPAWTAVKTASSESFYDFILDPYAPTTTGYLLSSAGVYRSTDLDQVTPSWSNVLTLAQMESDLSASGTLDGYYQMKACIASEGFLAFGIRKNLTTPNGRVYVYISADGGDNWTPNVLPLAGGDSTTTYLGCIEVSTKLSGSGDPIIYIATGAGGGTPGHLERVFRSTDGGSNWSLRAGPGGIGTRGTMLDMHLPFNDNANSDIILMQTKNNDGASGNYAHAISTDGGQNWSVVTGMESAVRSLGGPFNRTPFQTWTQDRQQMYAFTDDDASLSKMFYFSGNGGTTWVKKHEFASGARAAGGFPYNEGQFYVVTENAIWVSTDGGSNWTNKTGDFAWGLSFHSSAGGVIVPVWVAE
jgi:hypothetical protein